MDLRIKYLLEKSDKQQKDMAKELGISYNAFYNRIDRPNLKSLEDFAKVLNCQIHELIEAPEGFAHFYDDKTGEWLGIRKK